MKEFREEDQGKILAFVREYPLATVTAAGEDGWPVATHVPILVEERGDKIFLRGHVMRKTDHWHAFTTNPNILAIFHGPNCPVLASWYPETDNGGTWNYMVAHAYGTLTMLPEEELLKVLRELKDFYEGSAESWFDKLSPEYLAKMLPAIQAFEVEVNRLQAVFKLSQNRDDASYANIINKLNERGGSCREVAQKLIANRPWVSQ
ncbi:MAG: FMN-binding negative transcriptional regulator [Fimbriimonadaceae bacterium]